MSEATQQENTTPVPGKRSLIAKLAEVMGEAGRVAKNGRNDFHKYNYATEADIAEAVRGALAKRLVLIVPNVEKVDWETVQTKSGSQRLCTATVRFTATDGESGEVLDVVMIGQGADAGDKAFYKALTGAEKYMLLKLFLIPTGDDPEMDSPEITAPAQRQEASGKRTAEVKAKLAAKTARVQEQEGASEMPSDPEPPPPGDEYPQEAEPPRRAARPSATQALIPYGKSKGLPLSDATDKDLAWLHMTARENVEKRDPKWHSKNEAWLAAVQGEMQRRT